MAGVERLMLERFGEEVGRAASVVRYAPGSCFKEHTHTGGEEFLVLEGVFSDEHGNYGPGTYVRNPRGSRHAPFSHDGCTILVKLHHFAPGDEARIAVDTREAKFVSGSTQGLSVLPLHSYGKESTALVRWAPGAQFRTHRHWGGEEIFVLEGALHDEYGEYPEGTWIRSPHLSQHTPFSTSGCLIFVKAGHLPISNLVD
jgi:anti-sigma factor ChrR (cupin superfamily)